MTRIFRIKKDDLIPLQTWAYIFTSNKLTPPENWGVTTIRAFILLHGCLQAEIAKKTISNHALAVLYHRIQQISKCPQSASAITLAHPSTLALRTISSAPSNLSLAAEIHAALKPLDVDKYSVRNFIEKGVYAYH